MAIVAADDPGRAVRRVPLDYRTDDPRRVSANPARFSKPTPLAYLVLIESGRGASLDVLNRALVDDDTVRLCRPGQTCGSTLRCVLCSLYRMAERRADLSAALRAAPDAVMVTLTYAHGSAPLSEELDALDGILARFTKRGDWSRFQKRHGVTGYAVAREITYNATGWNVHVHLIVSLTSERDAAATHGLQSALTRRWCAAAAWSGYEAAEQRQAYSWMGTDFTAEDMSEYVTKQNLLHRASESARGRYPADLLAGAAVGDYADLDLYREYLDAVRGRGLLRSHGRLAQNRTLDFDELLESGLAWR